MTTNAPIDPAPGNNQTPIGPRPDTVKELFWKTHDYCQVFDVDDSLWDVRDARATKHGFDLLFGFPANNPLGSSVVGLPRLIATPHLKAYWEANRIARDGTLYDLPAGRSTLKRVRRRLGFNSLHDIETFFRSRIYDLERLSAREFANKHDVSIHTVKERRFRILGPSARPADWWMDPEPLQILSSKITYREMAEKLGIGTTHACRLRQQALAHLDPADKRVQPPRPRTRPVDWWTKPEALQLLTSDLTVREIAQEVGLSTGHISKLRKQALALVSQSQQPLAA